MNQSDNYTDLRLARLSSQLGCILLPTKFISQDAQEDYESIYRFWSINWQKAFSEIGMSLSSFSDEFCRHEKVVALTRDGFVIGCVLIDRFDLKNQVHLKHQYWSKYPEDILNKIQHLIKDKSNVMTIGYLAIDENFRKVKGLSDIVVGLAVKYFLLSNDAHILVSYTRNSRKTNDLTFRLGAQPLIKNIIVNDEPSDFVYFDKDCFVNLEKNICYSLIEKIWNNRKMYQHHENSKPLKQNQKGSKNAEIRFENSL